MLIFTDPPPKVYGLYTHENVDIYGYKSRYIKVFYSNMNKKIQHIIHMFIIKFMQENYHCGYITFSLMDFYGQKDE